MLTTDGRSSVFACCCQRDLPAPPRASLLNKYAGPHKKFLPCDEYGTVHLRTTHCSLNWSSCADNFHAAAAMLIPQSNATTILKTITTYTAPLSVQKLSFSVTAVRGEASPTSRVVLYLQCRNRSDKLIRTRHLAFCFSFLTEHGCSAEALFSTTQSC